LDSTWEPSNNLILSIAEEGTLPPCTGSKAPYHQSMEALPLNLDENRHRVPRKMTPIKPNILPHTPNENNTKPEIDHIGAEAAEKKAGVAASGGTECHVE
jgi:hypothetical protein